MSDYLKPIFHCSYHSKEFSESKIISHIKSEPKHSIMKLYKFKQSFDKDYFTKKIESTQKYLKDKQLENKSNYITFANNRNQNLNIIENIYKNIEYFITEKLKILDLLKEKVFRESIISEVERLMSKKLYISLNYENLYNIQPSVLNVEGFAKYQLRRRFCLRQLRSKMLSTPSCALYYKNDSFLLIGSYDSTIRCLNIKKKKISFRLTLHSAKVSTLTLYKPLRNTQGSTLEVDDHLISCSEDKKIIIWNMEKKKCVKTLKTHEHPIENSDINLSGTLFISKDSSGVILIWSLINWECLKQIILKPFSPLNSKFMRNDSLVIVYPKEMIITSNYSSIDHSIKLEIKFIEISHCKSFAIYLVKSLEEVYIEKFTINSRNREKIYENPDKFHQIKLNKSSTILIAQRDANFLIINLITRTLKDIQSVFFIEIVLPMNDNEFLIISQSISLIILNTESSTKRNLNITDFHLYDYSSFKIDKQRGLAHLIRCYDYSTYDIEKDLVLNKIPGKSITYITLNPLNGTPILGSKTGEVYLIKYQKNSFFLEELTSFKDLIQLQDLNHGHCPVVEMSNVCSMKVSDSGKLLAIGFVGGLEVVYSINSNKVIILPKMYGFHIEFHEFCESRNLLLSASFYRKIRVYDMNRKFVVILIDTQEKIRKVSFSLDYEFILCLTWNWKLRVFSIQGFEVGRSLVSNMDIKKLIKD